MYVDPMFSQLGSELLFRPVLNRRASSFRTNIRSAAPETVAEVQWRALIGYSHLQLSQFSRTT